MAKKKRRIGLNATLPFDERPPPKPPDFRDLLRKPLVKLPLPSDFDIELEAAHLKQLWQDTPPLQALRFRTFVHAGGSGLVFEVSDRDDSASALKVVRHSKYASKEPSPEVPKVLSPVSEVELKSLRLLKHPNLVLLNNAIANDRGIVAISTSYVSAPKPIDLYLRDTLQTDPARRGLHAFSPERLEGACQFLASKITHIASAIRYMHEQAVFHFDVKPANILMSEHQRVVLTDMGSCVHASDIPAGTSFRVHFTWTYAHPDLQDLIRDQRSISGGGLKVSAAISPSEHFGRYDLFALGRTIQECLAIIAQEFRERAHSSYAFRFLHVIACLLLDGRNGSGPWSRDHSRDGRPFVPDVALGPE